MSIDNPQHYHMWIYDNMLKKQVCRICGFVAPMGGWSPPGPFTNPMTVGDIIQQTDKGEKK